MATWKKVIVSGSDAHLNNITGSGLEISGIVSGSTISGSFVGDGSELTGVSATSFNIDGLSNGSAIIAGDKIFYSDAGTEKALPYEVLSSSIYGGVSGDITIAGTGVSTIGADTVANSMLENMTQGTVKVGGGSNAPTDLDAKTDGYILVGDGTDINSVEVTGDVALANNGAVTIQSNAVEGSMLNSNTAGGGLSYEVNSLNVDSGSFVAYMSSSAFSVVSGDIAIAAGGAATIQADSVQGTMLNDDVADDSTIEISSNNLSVLKVPNALTAGDGIDAGGTFDGANARTLSVSAAQTTITSVKHNSLVIGGNSQNNTIDFGTDDVILFDTDNTERMRVDAAGVDVTGALTVSTNATIGGNLTVQGTTTTLETTNTIITDQLLFVNSGSAASNTDGGIVVQSGSAVDSGSAIYHDITDERWAVAKNVASNATAITPLQYVLSTTLSTSTPGVNDGEYGVGEFWIDTNSSDGAGNGIIYIRTA
jgi:hypothetical protein|tara:strand:+ start:639 stop:2081 length:1443 start_codon:yes stop_codon:yes gene_type:complete